MNDFGIPRRYPPWVQVLVAFVFGCSAITLLHFYGKGGGAEYSGAFMALIFFALANCALSIFNEHFFLYTFPSWIWYASLLIFLLLVAKKVSGVSIWQLQEYRLLVVSVTAFYIITSLLVRIIRNIYVFASEEM